MNIHKSDISCANYLGHFNVLLTLKTASGAILWVFATIYNLENSGVLAGNPLGSAYERDYDEYILD
jgi:hypothetical protein